MQKLNIFLKEALIKKNTIVKTEFTDEELLGDYNEIQYAYTKAEKLPIAKKYGVNAMKIRDIQIAILDNLRENRKKKKDFTEEDVRNFFKYGIPESYTRLKPYLDEEPKQFVEFLFNYFQEKANNIYKKNYRWSYSDKELIKRYHQIQKYLNK